MNWQKVKWPVLLLSMAVTFGVLMGGGVLLKYQTVDSPLRRHLSGLPMVESHSVEKDVAGQVVKVKLRDTDDLQLVYDQVDKEARTLFGAVPYKILIEDARTPELERLHRRVNLFVQEGLATGEFTTMADRVQAAAAEAHVKAIVSVDNQRVYVQLHQGPAYLYTVIDRVQLGPTGTSAKGGVRS